MDPHDKLRSLGLEAELLARRRDDVQALLDEIRGALPVFIPQPAEMCWVSPSAQLYANGVEELRRLAGGVIADLQAALGTIATDLGASWREADALRAEIAAGRMEGAWATR